MLRTKLLKIFLRFVTQHFQQARRLVDEPRNLLRYYGAEAPGAKAILTRLQTLGLLRNTQVLAHPCSPVNATPPSAVSC